MGISIETLALARKYAKQVAKEEGVNQDFLSDFVTDKTTAEFCASITSCSAVKQGNSFMGGCNAYGYALQRKRRVSGGCHSQSAWRIYSCP